ncbi:MAG: NAD-dependent epimerase/dehydratase family protein [Parvibaculaceae bacterium]
MHVLITGASGKLGSRVVARLLAAAPAAPLRITAVTHSRTLSIADERLTVVQGNIAERGFVETVMDGVTHVVHMATCKEIPDLVMDVTVKGMFWLLDVFRARQAKYFILIGGDAAIGHYFYPADAPLTEATPHRAAPGCYSLSKVLEEVLLVQAHIQYGLQGCCLRAPWIMADDDLRQALTFAPDVFGVPRWHEEVGAARAADYARRHCVPLALAADGKPLKRGLVAVDDVVAAIETALMRQPPDCETFNIAMDEPFDYAEAAAHIKARFGQDSVDVPTPFHSVKMDNRKARQVLGWRPRFDAKRLIESAWAFERAPGAERRILYPG